MLSLKIKMVLTRLGFHVSYGSADLQQGKNCKLDKAALKNILYGSISELAKDRRYFYYTEIGAKYCHFTEDGEKAVLEILTTWVEKMLQEERRELDKRAKELVLKGLKGEET